MSHQEELATHPNGSLDEVVDAGGVEVVGGEVGHHVDHVGGPVGRCHLVPVRQVEAGQRLDEELGHVRPGVGLGEGVAAEAEGDPLPLVDVVWKDETKIRWVQCPVY